MDELLWMVDGGGVEWSGGMELKLHWAESVSLGRDIEKWVVITIDNNYVDNVGHEFAWI